MEELHFVDAAQDMHFKAMSLIHALGWRTTYRGAVPDAYMDEVVTDDRWVSFFREDCAEGVVHGLLLYRGDTPVACANYGPARLGESPRQSALVTFRSVGYEGWGEVISFYTHPDEKKKGYGGLLMGEVLRRLRGDGYPRCYLLVLRENENARRFYARNGFTPDGTFEEISFPDDTVCVDLRYVRAL